MIHEKDCKTGSEIIIESESGKGCSVIKILQNWRDILRCEEITTSGSINSDVWSEPHKFEVTVKTLVRDLNEMEWGPYGPYVYRG